MPTPIAIFYHCRIRSPNGAVKAEDTIPLMLEQMATLAESGLLHDAQDIFIGCNGDEADEFAVRCLAPERAIVFLNSGGATEIPTLNALHDWSLANPTYHVFYHHMKGATYPGNQMWIDWRKCRSGRASGIGESASNASTGATTPAGPTG